MIVIDTNIVAYLYLQTEFTHHAEGLLERDPECAAPMLRRSEFRNILAGHTRRKVLPADAASSLHAEAEDMLRGPFAACPRTRARQ